MVKINDSFNSDLGILQFLVLKKFEAFSFHYITNVQ